MAIFTCFAFRKFWKPSMMLWSKIRIWRSSSWAITEGRRSRVKTFSKFTAFSIQAIIWAFSLLRNLTSTHLTKNSLILSIIKMSCQQSLRPSRMSIFHSNLRVFHNQSMNRPSISSSPSTSVFTNSESWLLLYKTWPKLRISKFYATCLELNKSQQTTMQTHLIWSHRNNYYPSMIKRLNKWKHISNLSKISCNQIGTSLSSTCWYWSHLRCSDIMYGPTLLSKIISWVKMLSKKLNSCLRFVCCRAIWCKSWLWVSHLKYWQELCWWAVWSSTESYRTKIKKSKTKQLRPNWKLSQS